jgi:hypothetical protein
LNPIVGHFFSEASKGYGKIEYLSGLERLVFSAAPELYTELAKQGKKLKISVKAKEKHALLIVLDGMSVLEMPAAVEAAEKCGYKVRSDWGFATGPSISTTFIEKEFEIQAGPSQLPKEGAKLGLTIEYAKDEKAAGSLPHRQCDVVWVGEPDYLIHSPRAKFENVAEKVFESLKAVLDALRPRKAMVTSDHGYVPTGRWGIEYEISRELSEKLMHHRFVELKDFPEGLRLLPPHIAYHVDFNNLAILRGWYTPKRKLRPPFGVHGGMSLMELVTPLVEIDLENT